MEIPPTTVPMPGTDLINDAPILAVVLPASAETKVLPVDFEKSAS